MSLFEDEQPNSHRDRVAAVVRGALKSAIEAHGPITAASVESAVKRVVGQMLASKQTRIAIPVITQDQFEKLEAICAAVDGLMELSERFGADLGVLRDDNHPEGWCQVEVVETVSTPVAIVHHHRLQRPAKEYKRRRDSKVVPLTESACVTADV